VLPCCLSNNNADIHAIGYLTGLTALDLGPWEGDNFPVSFKKLVNLRHFSIQIKSDESVRLRDIAVFHKIAMVITHMPDLEILRFGWCTYSSQVGVVFLNPDTFGIRAAFLALCAYPRAKLRKLLFCYDHATNPGVVNLHGLFTSHVRPLALNTWSQQSGFPTESVNWKDAEFMAAWRASLAKVLIFM